MPATLRLSLALSALLLIGPAAAFAQDAAAPAEKVTYTDHVLPILRAKCAACHASDQAKGGLVVDSYTALMQGGASGEVVAATDLGGSRLWALVNHDEEPHMPPKEPKLPEAQLAVIKKWIETGALETSSSTAKAKKPAFSLGKTTISAERPEGPPPTPEGVPTEPVMVSPRGNAVTALATSPWAPLVAVAGHHQVLLYSTQDLRLLAVFPFPEGQAYTLKFSRNGSLLLAGGGRGGQSGRVVVWDVRTGKRAFEVGAEYDVVLAADISSDHSMIALGGPRKVVRVYSTADGELMYELKKHTDWITALEFSPDSVLLATGDRGNGLVVWEAFTGREFYVLGGHTAAITSVSWRLDSNLLASASEDTTIKLWELTNGSQVKNWGAHGGGAAAVSFTRDGRLVSTGRDLVTKLWDQNGQQLKAFPGLPDLGLEAAFSNEDERVLAGDWTGVVRVWDAKEATEVGQLATNPPPVAVRLESATKAAAAAQAAATAAAAALAALQKQEADLKTAADTAAKLLADADAAAKAATDAQAVAEKALADANADQKADAEKAVAAAKEKTAAAVAAAAAAKDASTKATAAAQITPERTKALTDAEAAAKVAADKAAKAKAAADQLAAEKAAQAKPPAANS